MIRRLASLALCVLLAACSSEPVKQSPEKSSPSSINEYSKIKSQIGTERWEVSAKRLLNFINQNPKTDLADEASMTLGQLLENQQRYSEAYNAYIRVVQSTTSSPREGEALVASTRMLSMLGRPDEALALSQRGIKSNLLSNEQKNQLHELRFQIFTTLNQSSEALKEASWLAANSTNNETREKNKAKITEIVDATQSEFELQKILDDSSLKSFHSAAALKLGRIAYEQKDFSRTRSYMEKVLQLSPQTPLAERAQQYLDQIDVRRRVRADTVGLVLPLTGRYASVGYKALHGVQLAIGTFWPQGTPLKLAVIDSEGNSDVGRRAVERLVNEDNVVAIIGGLTSKTAAQEAAKAQELGVPFIALSQGQGLTEIGDYIFRNSLTSKSQVAALVQQAMTRFNIKRFGILYPNDPYGNEFALAFFDEVTNRGGVIRAVQSYDPKETDFKEPIKKLVGTYYVDERSDEYRLRVKEWQDKQTRKQQKVPDDLLPPIVEFDALFVPDSVKALGQIAPMLSYNDVQNVKLLGTNLWNTSDLVKRGQKFVEGAMFVDTTMEKDANLLASQFYTDFQQTFQEEPGVFEMLGFESAVLIRKALMEGETSRVGVRNSLAGIKNLRGAVGLLSVSEAREVVRPLLALTVEKSSITPLPAL